MADPRNTSHPDEWFSIILAIFGTIVAAFYIGYWPRYEPESGGYWVIPVWCGLLYLVIQMVFLLVSASRVRAEGVLDSILAIVPVVAGLVILVQTIINANFQLSNYQKNTLAVLLVAGTSEFLLTIWIRFIINRRTLGVAGGN